MRQTFLFIAILLASLTQISAAAQKSTVNLTLGESAVRINIYENNAAQVTYFAPHYNERAARTLAREYVERNGGRLVEIESLDEKGSAARYLKFKLNGKTYTVDPNRIYTANGRNCSVSAEAQDAVRIFAESLLKIIFNAADGKSLRENERFIVAVHNNADLDARADAAKQMDLTAVAFVKSQGSVSERLADGAYKDQAEGVYLSNQETDVDNFIFLSTPTHVGYFAEKGFNIVVQKSNARLATTQCSVDDGSLSVYSSQNAIEYICLEADGANGAIRQRQMFEAVYALLPGQKQTDAVTTVVVARQ